MNSTWPPPQVIFVGLELNQHGHAASHEHASSSWPVIFHGVLSFAALTPRAGMARIPRPATSAHSGSKDVLFIASKFIPLMESRTGEFLRRRQAVAVALWAVGTGYVLRGCEALRTAKRLQKRAGDEARTRDVLLGKEVLYH